MLIIISTRMTYRSQTTSSINFEEFQMKLIRKNYAKYGVYFYGKPMFIKNNLRKYIFDIWIYFNIKKYFVILEMNFNIRNLFSNIRNWTSVIIKRRYLLILKIYFLMWEYDFLILENHPNTFLILQIHFLIKKMTLILWILNLQY